MLPSRTRMQGVSHSACRPLLARAPNALSTASADRLVAPGAVPSSTSTSTPAADDSYNASRRQTIAAISSAAAFAVAFNGASPPANAAANAAVSNYLPPAGIDDLVTFKPDPLKTPALRAGVIKPENPYSFALGPDFKEVRIANIKSGNFCMPNCGEAWTEVVFESDKDGTLQLLAAPLVKLTNKVNAKIEDLGSPEALLQRIGPFLTGTYLDDEDLVAASQKKLDDGRTYYFYELNAPGASIGPHSLTSSTTKGEVLYMFILSANEKQWSKCQKKLRQIVETFRA